MRGKRVNSDWWQAWPEFRRLTSETIQRKGLRSFHRLVCRLDDWCYKQEAKHQSPVTNHQSPDLSVDRVASSIREHARRRVAKFQKLKYAGGQFVKTIPIVLLILLGGSCAFAQDQEEKILVPRSILTKDQISQVSSKDLRTNVHEWAGIGKEVGEAVNSSLAAVTTQTNNFAQTGVGKLTVVLVVWRVLGDQMIHLAFGLLELLVFLPLWIWSYRRTCLTRRIEIEKGKYQVVEYDPAGEMPPRAVHTIGIVVLIGIVLATVFSY